MDSEKRKFWVVLAFAVLFATLVFVSVGHASAAEWHVYPGQSIQTAINNAGIDDTIHVHSGTYTENVNVSKRLTLIGIDNPVIDAGAIGSSIILTADGITLDGFTTTNPRPTLEDGGIIVYSNNNILKNNSAFYNNFCIYLNQSNNNTITGNDASNSDAWGIV
jgi:nitrous oxidase accessory protein